MYRVLILLVIFSAPLYAQSEGEITLLSKWMQGAFTSEVQSQQDEDFFNIHLYMKRIWNGEEQGHWLYVEQAAASRLDKPYRQRVYHLTALPSGAFRSEVYTFDDALKYTGDWQLDAPLKDLNPENLLVREGCAVLLRWVESQSAFIGSTEDKACKSNLRGATYATSKVAIFADRIESWDQGFDAHGQQVWGAVKSGYIFKRQPE